MQPILLCGPHGGVLSMQAAHAECGSAPAIHFHRRAHRHVHGPFCTRPRLDGKPPELGDALVPLGPVKFIEECNFDGAQLHANDLRCCRARVLRRSPVYKFPSVLDGNPENREVARGVERHPLRLEGGGLCGIGLAIDLDNAPQIRCP
ncbi:hypothetical protein LVJ94_34985 [Pendulispora rubella]|uniref:Uncharacterized protein n=1 Tax=Pendulispora rubella TaxID=2741070 RepID=A0ABZ2KTV2_9BACT